MEKRAYEILSGNTVTAKWQNDTLAVENFTLLPLYLRHNPNADQWLASRMSSQNKNEPCPSDTKLRQRTGFPHVYSIILQHPRSDRIST